MRSSRKELDFLTKEKKLVNIMLTMGVFMREFFCYSASKRGEQ
jgi:hypothetical protein